MSVRITSNDLLRFTEGDCPYLARAISKITGWPTYALKNSQGESDLHAFVLIPGTRWALDITGCTDVRRLVRKWGAAGYVRCHPDVEWGQTGACGECFPGSARRARRIAPLIVEKAARSQEVLDFGEAA